MVDVDQILKKAEKALNVIIKARDKLRAAVEEITNAQSEIRGEIARLNTQDEILEDGREKQLAILENLNRLLNER